MVGSGSRMERDFFDGTNLAVNFFHCSQSISSSILPPHRKLAVERNEFGTRT